MPFYWQRFVGRRRLRHCAPLRAGGRRAENSLSARLLPVAVAAPAATASASVVSPRRAARSTWAGAESTRSGARRAAARVAAARAREREVGAVDDEPVDLVDAGRGGRVVPGRDGPVRGGLGAHLGRRAQRGEQLHAEARHRLQDRHGVARLRGRRVDRAGRGRRQLLRRDEAVLGERLETLGEERRRDPGQVLAEVDEALVAEEQLAEDQQAPAIADEVERAGDRAVLAVALLIGIPSGRARMRGDRRRGDRADRAPTPPRPLRPRRRRPAPGGPRRSCGTASRRSGRSRRAR